MDFPPLIEGRLVRRYKRFLADIALPSGELVIAHCANPGRMTTCGAAGDRVWLSRSPDPRRKLAHTWELVEVDDGLVCVNTARSNAVVAEALAAGRVRELAGYDDVRREVRVGARSRIDFALERTSQRCYVEVKTVTLDAGRGVAAFPDAVTARGARHLRELSDLAAAGHRAVLLFCAARASARRVRPADDIDPAYGAALRAAAAAGVEVLAYRAELSTAAIALGGRIPVDL